jgi:hypothetical protein
LMGRPTVATGQQFKLKATVWYLGIMNHWFYSWMISCINVHQGNSLSCLILGGSDGDRGLSRIKQSGKTSLWWISGEFFTDTTLSVQ